MTETVRDEAKTFTQEQDRVTISAAEAVIEARNSFADWQVREMNHVPIYLEERKYLLVAKRRAAAPYRVKYVLQPWPDCQETNAKGFLTYDAEAVKERDARVREDKLQELGRAFLLPFYPLLGMLWSGMQRSLMRFGFLPHAMSGFSIFVSFSLFFGQLVFATMMLNTSLRTGKVMIGGFLRAVAPGDFLQLGPISIPIMLLDIVVTLALIADIVVRYSLYLRDDQWSGGFLEWIVPRSAKPVATAARKPSVIAPVQPVVQPQDPVAASPFRETR